MEKKTLPSLVTPLALPIEESQSDPITSLEYCENFAKAYAQNLSGSYKEGFLKLEKQKATDDEILANYTCSFRIVDENGAYKDIVITLFVVADKDFALAVKEKRWYIIPVAYIQDKVPEEVATEEGGGEQDKVSEEETDKASEEVATETNQDLVIEGYGIFMSHEKSPILSPIKPPANLKKGRSPKEYCESFATAYAQNLSSALVENSVTVEGEDISDTVEKWATNFFQPHGSKFVTNYKCHFETTASSHTRSLVLVYLFLVETYHFANHTQDEEWQVIPIEYIIDPLKEKEGYAVFKFLTQENKPEEGI